MRNIFLITGLFIFPFLSIYGQSDKELIKKGNTEYNNKKYSNSEINYRKALEKNRESTEGGFNLGDALYKQEKYEEAANQFKEIITKTRDEKIKAKAYHNLGNSLLKAKKYEESIEAYKNALKRSPGDEDSKYNLAYAKSMLVKEQQNKDKNKDKKDDKKDKNQKDQNKENEQNKDKNEKEKEKENQNENKEDKGDNKEGKQPKPNPQELSKEDAQRMLDALSNREKDLQKKATKKQGTRVTIEKNW